MEHTKSKCSRCNRELLIKIAKGENAPESVICKSCFTGIPKQKVSLDFVVHHWRKK